MNSLETAYGKMAYGKIVSATLLIVVITLLFTTIAAPASAQPNACWTIRAATNGDGLWHVEFAPVPSYLRAHVPQLPSEVGQQILDAGLSPDTTQRVFSTMRPIR